MDDAIALSLAETERRFNERQEYLKRALGYHATAAGSAFYKECIPRLADFIREELEKSGKTHPSGLRPVLKRLKNPELIALSALTALLQSIPLRYDEDCEHPRHVIFEQLGTAIHGECRKRRRTVFTSSRTKSPFASSVWNHEEICLAGGWLQDCVVKALPEVFAYDEEDMPYILPVAVDNAAVIATKAMFLHPVLVACQREPEPWTGFREGGYWTHKPSISAPFVRGCDEKTERAIRAAMTEGSLRPHVDAVNSQQAVPWTIDERMLDVVRKFGPYHLADQPGAPRYWWKKRGKDSYKVYEPDDHLLFVNDMAAADRLRGEPFWVPVNVDFRGRIYAIPFFNYARQDWVRSLFRFKRGQPIGDDGIYWLKIYTATTGDFDQISKRPFPERLEWVKSNTKKIHDTAAQPVEEHEWWKHAGLKKKFQFLSACIELSEALRFGPTYISRLPVSFDATASGLQHLCAMSRADEGALVNLAPSELPRDVYKLIAHAVAERVRRKNLYAAAELLIIGLEITRALIKSCVMTYFYNSGEWNQTRSLTKFLREKGFHQAADNELTKLLREADLDGPAGKELSYDFRRGLIRITRAIIENKLRKPKEVMELIGNLALILAATNKPLSWISPSGMPICNRYQVPNTRRVEFRLNRKKHQYTIANGFKPELDAEKMETAAAPNFVHSCDAAHMALVTNAAVAEGIVDLAMVHDSFSCPAAQAGRFREIIREQFVKMYEQHDILTELRNSAALALGGDENLPPVPDRGNLDLRGVLQSDFAFD